jgi:plasmid stabilization system protein ParE
MSKIDIKPDWTPTPASITALPEPLRRYIHDLETVCDPAGDVAEIFRLREENKLLRSECERLASMAGEGPSQERAARTRSLAQRRV